MSILRTIRGRRVDDRTGGAVTFDITRAVEDFWTARARGEFFPRAYSDRLTLDEAYRIQLALIERRCAAGECHIGWKVGLTAKAIQEQFGFFEPVFGCILETRPSGHVFGATKLINPGFETELCIRLARALEGDVSLDDARAAIDVIHPSFEIIETRGDFVKQIPLAMADNAQQRSVILGRRCVSRLTSHWKRSRRALSSMGRKLRAGSAARCSAIP
jgi:2-keto-4-pentenoate hydratase